MVGGPGQRVGDSICLSFVENPGDDFVRLVQAGFAQPRKTLRNSLAQGQGSSTAEASALLTRAAIDPARRPQELALDDWLRLYRTQ